MHPAYHPFPGPFTCGAFAMIMRGKLLSGRMTMYSRGREAQPTVVATNPATRPAMLREDGRGSMYTHNKITRTITCTRMVMISP